MEKLDPKFVLLLYSTRIWAGEEQLCCTDKSKQMGQGNKLNSFWQALWIAAGVYWTRYFNKSEKSASNENKSLASEAMWESQSQSGV